MKIEGTTIVFKSAPEWYELERSGEKPATVRLLSEFEHDEITQHPPTHIRIQRLWDEGTCFTRTVRGVYELSDVCGQILVMVCWHE